MERKMNLCNNAPMPPGFYLMDCMEAMKQFPDKFFDLAVVDPPYGGGGTNDTISHMRGGYRTLNSGNAPGSEDDSTDISVSRTGGTWATKYRQRKTAVRI